MFEIPISLNDTSIDYYVEDQGIVSFEWLLFSLIFQPEMVYWKSSRSAKDLTRKYAILSQCLANFQEGLKQKIQSKSPPSKTFSLRFPHSSSGMTYKGEFISSSFVRIYQENFKYTIGITIDKVLNKMDLKLINKRYHLFICYKLPLPSCIKNRGIG